MAGIYEDQIKKYEDGVRAIRESVPMQAFDPSGGTAPAARPRAAVSAIAPTTAARPVPASLAGTAAGIGSAVRRGAGTAVKAAGDYAAGSAMRLGGVADAATAIPRAAGEAVSNLGRGLAGRPAVSSNPAPFTNAAGSIVTSLRGGSGGRPAAAPKTGPGFTAARPQPRADFTGVTATVDQSPTAAAPAAPGAAAAPALNPGDVNTFTGSNGVTRAVPGLLNAEQTPQIAARPVVTAPPGTAPAALPGSRTTQRDIGNNATGARAQIGADAMNGFSPTSELMRRLEISQGSFKGSPKARATVAQALLSQMGAITDATTRGAAAQNDAALQGQRIEGSAVEGDAGRAQRASEVNAELTNSYDARADQANLQREERLARRPDVTVAADGAMGMVGADGIFKPVTGTDGKAVRAPQAPRQTGELSQGERLKALTDLRTAAVGLAAPEAGSPERQTYDARLAELDGQIAEIMGGGSAGPTFEQFQADARSKGSKMTDEQLRAYFTTNYGQ